MLTVPQLAAPRPVDAATGPYTLPYFDPSNFRTQERSACHGMLSQTRYFRAISSESRWPHPASMIDRLPRRLRLGFSRSQKPAAELANSPDEVAFVARTASCRVAPSSTPID